ncbi:MAG: winged helix-turn-helix transcriptional regulator [Candidatus Thorarchaeota archaeon]
MEKSEKSILYDYKDIQIIRALDTSHESRISTKEISKELDIPSRSIRYRLTKLKENNLLKEKSIITHERKIGIREHFFAIEENANKREEFEKVISNNPAISWYVPTTGKYNGFLVHAISSLNAPNHPLIIMEKMKEKGIISDYYHFEIIDYFEIGWNYDFFSLEGDWVWSWENWYKMIIKNKTNHTFQFTFEENPPITNFDFIDIQILKFLYLSETITQKELGIKLELSESQISRRIKSLEQNGIIRGYRTGFQPFSDTIILLFIIESKNNMKRVLDIISDIPYPKSLAHKNSTIIGLGVEIPSNDFKELLAGFHLMRNQIDSYFLQIYLKKPLFNPQNSFDLFDKNSNSWINLEKEYNITLENFSK